MAEPQEQVSIPAGKIAPPSYKPMVIQNKMSLVLELIWLQLITLPLVLFSIIKGLIFSKPEKSLTGQVALVTGAGRGLGRGLALQLAREGCRVAVVDIYKHTAEETAAEICQHGGLAKAYECNVASVPEIASLRTAVTADLGPVDLLVNNAAIIHSEPLEYCTDDAVKAVVNVNIISHFWMAREFLPSMRERNAGHVVAIASIASLYGLPNLGAYVSTKFALRGFMEVLQLELDARPGNQIKTTTIHPYFINTSADYMDLTDIRIPALTTDDVVNATVTAIKRNQECATVPAFHYKMAFLYRLFPKYLQTAYRDVLKAKIIPPSPETVERMKPPAAVITW